jgi:Spy/CpxP family protein refolding chaperone
MWLALALAVVAGAGLGVALDRLVLGPRASASTSRNEGSEERHQRHEKRLLERLRSELDLEPDQEARLKDLLENNHDRARAFWDNVHQDYARLRQDFRSQIRALLTPEQQTRFDRMLERQDSRRKDKRR